MICASEDLAKGVLETDISFVSIPTPSLADGSCNLEALKKVAVQIGEVLRNKDMYHVVVLRSSVPPGTCRNVLIPILENVSKKIAGTHFGVCFNPEFLREGCAIDDFFDPGKTVIGSTDVISSNMVSRIFDNIDEEPMIASLDTAEMIKYAENVWHATKVCFGNEIGRICRSRHIDGSEVIKMIASDHKLNISSKYLQPGFAYGGSCLPKEVRSVQHMAHEKGVMAPLIESLSTSNQAQLDSARSIILQSSHRSIGIVGLSFKKDTDDLRGSPTLYLAEELLILGCNVEIYDPEFTDAGAIIAAVDGLYADYPREAGILSRLSANLCPDLPTLLDRVPLVVFAINYPELFSGSKDMFSEHTIVDLCRSFQMAPVCKKYCGIGW